MGKYIIDLSIDATNDLKKIHKSGDQATIKKVETLLKELETHPTTGTGKPERLRHSIDKEYELWSRRIDKKNRMVYSIKENIVTVYVFSFLGHYDDK